jgi:ketosteroid isomerase-like protein
MTADLITPRIQQIVDRTDILDVVTRYAAAIDTGDWAALASLFTDDASLECLGFEGSLGGSTGPEGITKFVGAVVRPLDGCQHINTNHLVSVYGDEAEHTGYFLAQHVRRGLADGELFLVAGRYDDRLRRTQEHWRFTHRTVTFLWCQGNPAVAF